MYCYYCDDVAEAFGSDDRPYCCEYHAQIVTGNNSLTFYPSYAFLDEFDSMEEEEYGC